MKKIVVFLSVLTAAQFGFAKDLTHRLGVGFRDSTSISVPSVAGVYYYEKDLAFTASVGVDTEKDNSRFQGSVGARSVVYFENNLNCYVSGQAGVINIETPAGGKNSGVELMGLGGVEFFFTGLENLAFTAEAGLGVASIGNTRIYSTALSPVRAGITFYF
ncbi:MAG: organic solvent tolerance protein [Pseudobdellovibrio sp.]